jgi:hypothetical protein
LIKNYIWRNKTTFCNFNLPFFLTVALLLGISAVFLFVPEFSFAQFGGSGFETKVQNINTNLITRILPLVSIFGLFYATVLAITGDGEAKGKIFAVLLASATGFLAPMIIDWLKGLAL